MSRINSLKELPALTGAEWLPVENESGSKKIQAETIKNFVGGGGGATVSVGGEEVASVAFTDDPQGQLDGIKQNLGDLTDGSLETTEQDSLVKAINEVNGHAGAVDEKIGDLGDLGTTRKDSVVNAINEVQEETEVALGAIGTPSALETEDKTSLVAAINEVNTKVADADIVSRVIEALGTPVFGTIDADNTITLSGALADGTYTIQYENKNGTKTDIGTITVIQGNGGPQTIPVTFEFGKINSSTGAIETSNQYVYTNEIILDSGKTYTLHIPESVGSPIACKISYYGDGDAYLSTSEALFDDDIVVGSVGDHALPMIEGAKAFRLRVYCSSVAQAGNALSSLQANATITAE